MWPTYSSTSPTSAAARTTSPAWSSTPATRSELRPLELDATALLDFGPDDRLREVGDDLPGDLLDDFARKLRDRFVFGPLRRVRGQLLLDRGTDGGMRGARRDRRGGSGRSHWRMRAEAGAPGR